MKRKGKTYRKLQRLQMNFIQITVRIMIEIII